MENVVELERGTDDCPLWYEAAGGGFWCLGVTPEQQCQCYLGESAPGWCPLRSGPVVVRAKGNGDFTPERVDNPGDPG